MKNIVLYLSVVTCCYVGLANAQLLHRPVAATPQRPSTSYNTSVVNRGWLEVELGSAIDSHFIDSPVVFKLGLQRNLEFFFGASPVVHVSDEPTATGFGDVTLGVRSRLGRSAPGLPSFAVLVAVKIPTADEEKGLGTGRTDWTILFILSQTTPQITLDFNVGFKTTNVERGISESRLVGVLTGSRNLTSKVSAYAEAFFSHQVESRGTAVSNSGIDDFVLAAGAGLGYSVSKKLVIDAAVNVNIVHAPYDLQFLIGATWTMVKLW